MHTGQGSKGRSDAPGLAALRREDLLWARDMAARALEANTNAGLLDRAEASRKRLARLDAEIARRRAASPEPELPL